MNAEEFKALQAPLKDQYKTSPEAALITLRAKGRATDGIACKVETGRALVEAGLHPATGGDGSFVCSGDMLLDATVTAEGDLDFRGTLGVSKEVAVGFQRIRLAFDLETGASEEQLATLIRLTERYCVVFQTLRRSPEITVSRSAAS